jgi:hypothetical protein
MDAVMRVFVWYYIIVLGLLLRDLVLLMTVHLYQHEILYTDSQDMLVYHLSLHCATTDVQVGKSILEIMDTPHINM